MKKQASTLLPALLDLLRQYLALDMAVYAGHATLLLLTASLPLLMWVLMLVNLVPGFSVEGVAELLADFLPQIPEIQTAILGLLQNLSGQSAQFVASLAVLTTIVSASGGMNALQIGLQRLTPGSWRLATPSCLSCCFWSCWRCRACTPCLRALPIHCRFFAITRPLWPRCSGWPALAGSSRSRCCSGCFC